jgi:plastocyanin
MKGSTKAAVAAVVAVVVIVALYEAYPLLAPPRKIVPVTVAIPKGVGANSGLNFSPATLTVVIGFNNTVIWINKDSVNHTVDAFQVPQGAAKFSSGLLQPGQNFTVTLTLPGVYAYQCSIHAAWMQGAVVVKKSA